MVRKTHLAPEMSITLCARYSDGSENTRRAGHAFATRMLTAMRGFTRAAFVTCITPRHHARYIHDHVVVLNDIIVEQIDFLWGADLPFENYVFKC